jgi:G6PDH family F420-dependent oxidoreductase
LVSVRRRAARVNGGYGFVMTRYGYFLASEEHGPKELVRQAQLAEDAGFVSLWISDHFHPWSSEQGQSPFVWSTIAAVSRVCALPITTAVTCPTVRIHPAIVAQAATTSAVLTDGRFTLGLGSGEALNEHITGEPWPPAPIRIAMLEEAIEVIRQLFTGELVNHRGRFYRVDNARLFTLPERAPEIYVSAFGPISAEVAGRVADGLITTSVDEKVLDVFRRSGGSSKPVQVGFKVCYGPDADEALQLAHRLWAVEALPGELGQVLPTMAHFEQASSIVTPQMMADSLPHGPDPEPYIARFREFSEAGFEAVHVQQIGPDQEAFFSFFTKEILPALP